MELPGSTSRETFRTVLLAVMLCYGGLCVALWICYVISNKYYEGTSVYPSAVMSLAIQTSSMMWQYFLIRHLLVIWAPEMYQYRPKCSIDCILLFHIGYTFLAIVCGSIVCIGVSAVFGVRYGQNGENKIVNKHKNVTMGITCVATGCVTLVVSSVHLIYALKLRQAFLSFRNKIQNVEISYGTTSGL